MDFKGQLYKEINLIDILGVFLVLTLASIFQFVFKELPCPLCLLQRFGFFLIGMGFLFNLKFGARPSHYAMATFGALFTASVAARQMLLHIVPGSGSYGSPFLGLHLYTWTFIAAVLFVLWICFQLMIERQFQHYPWYMVKHSRGLKYTVHLAFAAMLGLCMVNLFSVFMICGFHQCPEEPTHYIF